MQVLSWNIYEVTSANNSLESVMFRWTIRAYCLEILKINSLQENVQKDEKENTVRFALIHEEADIYLQSIKDFIVSKVSDAIIELVFEKVQNPVLSKLKVNITERYHKHLV
jgi:hypothetical protein